MALDLTGALEADNRGSVREARWGAVRWKEKPLVELFRAMHMAKAADWSKNHALAQKRFSEFWLKEFGPKTPLSQVTAHRVETAAKKYPGGLETRRKLLVYITGAYP